MDSERVMQISTIEDSLRSMKGCKGSYLGYVPAFESSGKDCTHFYVEKILDACNINEDRIREVFVEIYPTVLKMYIVDENHRILETMQFDYTRISYCCGTHKLDSRIFSIIYRLDSNDGVQLECHAIRFESEQKATLLAKRLFGALQRLQNEIEDTNIYGNTFLSKCKQRSSSSPMSSFSRQKSKKSSGSSMENSMELFTKYHRKRDEVRSQDNPGYTRSDELYGSSVSELILSVSLDNIPDVEDNVFLG